LAHYVASGELDILDFISPEKLQLISDYFKGTKDQGFGLAREVLGDSVSYGELRMVQDWLKGKELEGA
jgi:ATP-dependent DNA helicase RecQ